MKIGIFSTENNISAVNVALEVVNGSAMAFTVNSFAEVTNIAARAEARLEKSGILKKNRSGVVVSYTPVGPSAKSYKYAAKSTRVRLERGLSEWFLTDVSETRIYPRDKEKFTIIISEKHRADIISHAMLSFSINV